MDDPKHGANTTLSTDLEAQKISGPDGGVSKRQTGFSATEVTLLSILKSGGSETGG
jgi:hypothetical protein